jgi:membrane protein EpsK
MAAVSLSVAIASRGGGVTALLLGSLVAAALGTAAQSLVCSRLLPGWFFAPPLHREERRAVFEFGAFSCLQSVGWLLFSYIDRLVVARSLGSESLAVYAICVQLAQQLHALPANAFAFVVPRVSRRLEGGDGPGLQRLYLRWMALAVLGVSIPTAVLVAAARPILCRWMGCSFASGAVPVLSVLCVGYAVLGFGLVPQNVLVGMGRVRAVALLNLLGGVLSVSVTAAITPAFGLEGAAAARLFYSPSLVAMCVLAWKSLHAPPKISAATFGYRASRAER